MIIFLYGQDSYSLIKYVNQLVERYHKKYPESFNLHRFDLEEDNPSEIENTIKGSSFFKQVKFIVAKNPVAKSTFIEKVIKENEIAKEKDTVLLLYQNSPEKDLKEKNGKLFGLLKKQGQVKEFKLPTIQAAAKFAANYLAKNKISIQKEGLNKLTKEVGPDFWRLRNELDKIIGFAKAAEGPLRSREGEASEPRLRGREEKKKNISEEEMTKLVNFKVDQNIFNITEAAFSNQAKALTLFNDYFANGGDPLYLLSMIVFQLKNMLIVRELIDKKHQYPQILKKTGMHPFFFKKNYEAAQKYGMEDLKKIFQKAVNFEVAFKTGQAETENIFFKIFL